MKNSSYYRNYIPFSFTLVLITALAAFNNGCSSTTATNNESTVQMQSQLGASDVSRTVPIKVETPQGPQIDSLVITSAVVFVSDVKLHADIDLPEADDHDQTIKTGPFVLVFDSSGTHVVTSAAIPPGTYDYIKFEIRKPDPNTDAAILAQYPELQYGNQTYSVWIYGYIIQTGLRVSFAVQSAASANLTLKFKDKGDHDKDNLVLNANTLSTLA
ncbi:MAG TPA: hypothetical protein VGM92_10410, partial [Candidatus Kapabacteria bacterium]